MSKVLGPEWFSDKLEDKIKIYQQVLGTYESNWAFLRQSAESSFQHAVNETGNLLNIWRSNLEEGVERAEIRLLIYMNYMGSSSGPLFSSITSTAFAIESFLRLCVEIIVCEQSASNEKALIDAVARFDKHSFLRRFDEVLHLTGAGVNPELRGMVKALVDFRNDCAHDAPLQWSGLAEQSRVKHGERAVVNESRMYGGMYPPLHGHNLPLRLRHARLALQTHDDLVAHVRERGSEQFQNTFEARFGGTPFPKWIPSKEHLIEQMIQDWESDLLPWYDGISNEENEAFYRTVIRRATITEID